MTGELICEISTRELGAARMRRELQKRECLSTQLNVSERTNVDRDWTAERAEQTTDMPPLKGGPWQAHTHGKAHTYTHTLN